MTLLKKADESFVELIKDHMIFLTSIGDNRSTSMEITRFDSKYNLE